MASEQSIPQTPILHLHQQKAWHDDSYIVANRAGLIAIRSAIDRALASGQAEVADTSFCADGEGFRLFVVPYDYELHTEQWDELRLPYLMPYEGAPPLGGPLLPHQLIPEDRLRRLINADPPLADKEDQ